MVTGRCSLDGPQASPAPAASPALRPAPCPGAALTWGARAVSRGCRGRLGARGAAARAGSVRGGRRGGSGGAEPVLTSSRAADLRWIAPCALPARSAAGPPPSPPRAWAPVCDKSSPRSWEALKEPPGPSHAKLTPPPPPRFLPGSPRVPPPPRPPRVPGVKGAAAACGIRLCVCLSPHLHPAHLPFVASLAALLARGASGIPSLF